MNRASVLVGVIALSGCELFVDVPRGTLANGGDGGPAVCTDNAACSAPAPLCDLTTSMCVECLVASDCPVERSLCVSGVCRACAEDDECASAVCMPDGSCADPARVLYSDAAGTGDCARATPCSLDAAVGKLAAGRDIVKLAAGTYLRTATITPPANALFTGAGATVRAMGTMFFAAFQYSGLDVALHRLAIDAPGGMGVSCQGSGKLRLTRVTLTNGLAGAYGLPCEVTVDRTFITGATFYGLYVMAGPARVTNTIIAKNGGAMGSSGGLVLDAVIAGSIEHVTVTGNTATSMPSGVSCTNNTTVALSSSIVVGNAIAPACNVSYSVIDAGYTGAGMANNVVDPMFVNAAANDYHLSSGSPAAGKGDPASTMTYDFDGEARPRPAGTAPDPGADEVP